MPAGLLGTEDLTREEIEAILTRARDFQPVQRQAFKRMDTLRGKMVVNLFLEPSTRTRTSFEIAARRLGGDVVSISGVGSSLSKGESLVDTLNTLAAMRPNAIVMRHKASGHPDHQCRRRRPRTPHPGVAGRPYHPRPERNAGGTPGDHHR